MAQSYVADSVGRVLGGRYRLLRAIGSGTSADVFAAEDVQLRRRVAVKLLQRHLAGDPAFLRRFRAEALTVAGLRHPSIVTVHDWGEEDGTAYLVTELLEGGSLRSLLDTGARLSPSQAVSVGFQVGEALEYAHRRGLVHRDIKPANLLFDEEGRVSVADFGLAVALAEAAGTEPGTGMAGTLRYLAPEQVAGRNLDRRADVYALALTLAEATTGELPFARDTPDGTRLARREHPIHLDDRLSGLADVLEAAGTIDPEDRSDAATLLTDLRALAPRLPHPEPLPLTGLAPLDPDVRVVDPTVLPDGDWTGPASAPAAGQWGEPAGTVAGSPPGGAAGADVTRVASEPEDPTRTARHPVLIGGPTAGEPRPAVAWPEAPEGPDGLHDGRPRRRRRLVLASVIVAGLLVVGGGGVAAWQLTRPKPEVAVPLLRGRQLDSARQLLGTRHLALTVAGQAFDPTVPSGAVISQTPTGGELREDAVVAVTVSKGPQPVRVPSVAGSSLDEATRLLQASGLAVGTVRHTTSITVASGLVIRSSPAGGELLPGTQVTLVVSTGKPSVTVPLLQAAAVQTYAAAAAALSAAHLAPVQAQTYNNTVPVGEVITTVPAPGATALYGSTVTVQISLGPHLVTVPSVKGMSVAQADAALTQAGLNVSGVNGNPGGTVKGTYPHAGASVLYGSSILIATH